MLSVTTSEDHTWGAVLNGQPAEDVCCDCGLACDSFIDGLRFASRDNVISFLSEPTVDGRKLKREVSKQVR
jgi:hypothetical protein